MEKINYSEIEGLEEKVLELAEVAYTNYHEMRKKYTGESSLG